MTNCESCGQTIYQNTNHRCAPVFMCYRPDHSDADEAEKVYCWGEAKHAAEDYCDINFSKWDYPSYDIEVNVISPDGTETQFMVEVVAVPEFTANEKKKK
jgi:hypothetical protein